MEKRSKKRMTKRKERKGDKRFRRRIIAKVQKERNEKKLFK